MSYKRNTQFTILSVLLVLGFVLAGCSSSSLIGKWSGTDPDLGAELIIEFKSDGTVVFEIPDLMTFEGTYKLVDANTVSMTLSFLGQEETTEGDFSISGNTLSLINEDGSTQELTRVP